MTADTDPPVLLRRGTDGVHSVFGTLEFTATGHEVPMVLSYEDWDVLEGALRAGEGSHGR